MRGLDNPCANTEMPNPGGRATGSAGGTTRVGIGVVVGAGDEVAVGGREAVVLGSGAQGSMSVGCGVGGASTITVGIAVVAVVAAGAIKGGVAAWHPLAIRIASKPMNMRM